MEPIIQFDNLNIINNNKNNNSFSDLKEYCLNDSLLYVFFKLIQADYNFYQQCLGIFQGILYINFKSFALIPRGSFAAKTGLKSTMDLDLDFILPREYIKPDQLDISQFPVLLNEINQIILNSSKISTTTTIIIKNINESFSRTLKYSLTYEGIEIFIDLFPKLVSSDGKLVSPSHLKDEFGNRHWEYSDIIEVNGSDMFKEYHIAAILFIKLYKNDIIELELKENSNKESIIKFLKGYHLCLAMERIIEKSNNNNSIDENDSKFSISNIYNLIIQISNYLIIAYDSSRFNNEKYQYNNNYSKSDFIFNNVDPFYEDLKHLETQDFNIIVNHLYNLKNKIKITMNK